MKITKPIVKILLGMVTLFATNNTNGQCTNTLDYYYENFTACIFTISTSCNDATSYNEYTGVVPGKSYTITSTISTDFITVRSGTPNGTVVGFGVQPVTVVAPVGVTVFYVHINSNSSCGTNGSCRDIVVTCTNCTPVPPNCASLSSPANGANLTTTTPTLSWGSVSCATSYDLYMGASVGTATLIANKTTTSHVVSPSLAPGTYYWYVVPKNTAGDAVGCSSSARNFTILPTCLVPDTVTSFSVNGASPTSISGSFTAPSLPADKYILIRTPGNAALNSIPVSGTVYSSGAVIGNGMVVAVGTTTSFTDTFLTPGTQYTYTVYSLNDQCSGFPPLYSNDYTSASAFTASCPNFLTGVKQIPGDYPSITSALADIKNLGMSGPVTLELTSGYSSAAETFPITISNNGCMYPTQSNTLTIRPGITGLQISGAVSVPIIDLNNVSNIAIDGRVGGMGSTPDLKIINTSASGVAVRFINEASGNTVSYCDLQGQNTSVTASTTTLAGVVYFAGTTILPLNGNDNNVISNCLIHGPGSATPAIGITSTGSTTFSYTINENNSILNSEIYAVFHASSATTALRVGTGNSGWTISGNKIYQPSTRLYTTANTHNGINVSSGSGYTISGNILGFANANGTGSTNMVGSSSSPAGFPSAFNTAGTANATRYIGINCAFTAGGTVSNIQGNTVAGYALYTSSSTSTTNGMFCGIYVTAGNVNIGTVTGNTIGNANGNGGIYTCATASSGALVGIYVSSTNTVSIQNNVIAGLDAVGTTSSLASAITGIDVTGAGSFTIANNTIGSSFLNNIRTGNLTSGTQLSNVGTQAQSTGTGAMIGIRSAMTGNQLNITDNLLQGWSPGSTGGALTGITCTGTMTGTTPSLNITDNKLGTPARDWINYKTTSAASGTITGISSTGGGATTRSIQNNDIRGITYSVASTGANTYFNLTGATAANNIASIDGNTFTNLSLNTTGAVTFISHSYAIPSTGTLNITNNAVVTGFSKTPAASGNVIFTTNATSGSLGAVINYTNNNFSNISVLGSSTLTGFNNTEANVTKNISGNTFNQWTAVTGAINTMNFSGFAGTSSLASNTITNISGQGAITGITIGSTASTANPLDILGNTIKKLVSSGTGGNVTGITCANSAPVVNLNGNVVDTLSSTGASSSVTGIAITNGTATSVFGNRISTLSGSGASSPTVKGISVTGGNQINVYKNKVYDLLESGSFLTTNLGAVTGLSLGGGTNVTAYNNLVGDLRTPNANLTEAIRGIGVTANGANTSYNVYFNTVLLNATSAGATFGTSGLYHTGNATATTAKLDFRNNIIVNNSLPNGTGISVAFRRSTGAANTLSNYASTSDNNLFYAGIPSANNLIYADGTDTAQILTSYKTGNFSAGVVGSRDTNSVSENPNFLSTAGSAIDFLHVNPSIPTLIEGSGISIAGITEDFDGDIRTATPDLGADEFLGSNPLNLDIVDFRAINVGEQNKLDWVILNENGVNYFELERSKDGKEFSYLATIKTEKGMSGYRYFDSEPLVNWNHYRLKLLYLDGEESYSKVASALVKSVVGPLIKTFPNPVDERVTVELIGSMGSNPQLLISDVSGRLITVLSVTGKQPTIDMKGYASGTYFIKYQDDSTSQVIQVNKR